MQLRSPATSRPSGFGGGEHVPPARLEAPLAGRLEGLLIQPVLRVEGADDARLARAIRERVLPPVLRPQVSSHGPPPRGRCGCPPPVLGVTAWKQWCQPAECREQVPVDPWGTRAVKARELDLGVGIAAFCGPAVPTRGLGRVDLHSLSADAGVSEADLSREIALFRWCA
jgi:hypothetical protein